ncbi:MAG: PKD domain-containing protein [Methanoregula sp.]|nr:PKD domain-containing protein [Methanoregula sp.]
MKQSTIWLFLILAAGLTFLPAVAGATTPVASFTSNITSGSVPASVQFIDTSSYIPTSWVWSFGDGGTSSEQDPIHTYSSAGSYTVTLTTTNADGSNTITRSKYISASKSQTAPAAAFLSNISSGSQPLAVQFVDSSSNSPIAWAWSFGDGGTSSEQNPVHTYTTTGDFTVTLSAVNTAGSSTVSKDTFITVTSTSSAPDASFEATETTGSSPLTIQFIDTSNNAPTSWVWSFGDGGTSTAQNPSHTYVTAGTYTVTLTVTNSGGSSTETESDYITVEETEPVAAFTANTTSGLVPLVVQFSDTSSNTPTSWYWYFGDGGSSTEQDPVYEYDEAGSYTVSLTATNDEGSNTTTRAKYINVTAITPPAPSFNADVTSGTAPLTVRFTDTTTNSPLTWEWNFGDGSSSTLQNPAHTYTTPGSYSVVLTVTNAGGSRTATTSQYIVVSSSEVASATPEVIVDIADTATAEPTTVASTAAPSTGSGQDGSTGTYVIVAVIVLLGIGAIAFVLMKRPPRGPHHSSRREL